MNSLIVQNRHNLNNTGLVNGNPESANMIVGITNVDAEKIKQIMGSKREITKFLYYECNYFIHPPEASKISYLQKVWTGEKKVCVMFMFFNFFVQCKLHHEVLHKKEFGYKGLTIARLLRFFKDHHLEEWIPANDHVLRYDRQWLIDVNNRE